MNPNISQHGNSLDFSNSDRKKFLEGRSREATDAEHRLALNGTGVNTAAVAQQLPGAEW